MTDFTPPSIPPRKRPTTPTTAGRTTTSAPHQGSTSAWNGSADGDAATHVPSLNGSNGATAFTVPASVMPPTVAPPRSSPPDRPEATERPASAVRTEAAPATATSPQDRDTSAPGVGDEHDPPSPMMVAVDTATVWLKKAGVATSAAFAAATRPRPKEPTMTTTPAASAPAASTTAPRPVPASDNLTGARPSTGRIPTVGPHGAPRRVRLAISRVDPWSVMKLSFLLSVAIGVMIVVGAAVVWFTLNGLQVFTKANDLVTQITGTESGIDILQYVEFQRIISGATLVAVIDVFLLTALATIGAFLYNIVAALVGGVHVTMTDE
ncbi:DUF3566 domain-containing protein [Cellulomonas humilata]|uniref:DUF3566 domain-containing protein n=1 Tax=Cellulomonas humilata TaxID=144055 RepID=A0A7Y6A3E9_9CELL|nr:DUF3566 domain-containing protein [Cellulomonas humilata]NUU19002.1 DUF3566 domain-containing protein [Cellulomonas humilata]